MAGLARLKINEVAFKNDVVVVVGVNQDELPQRKREAGYTPSQPVG